MKIKNIFFSDKTIRKKTSNMSVNVQGLPIVNHVDVDTCPGCILGLRNPGLQTLWFDFKHKKVMPEKEPAGEKLPDEFNSLTSTQSVEHAHS